MITLLFSLRRVHTGISLNPSKHEIPSSLESWVKSWIKESLQDKPRALSQEDSIPSKPTLLYNKSYIPPDRNESSSIKLE
jgi:hypothetical protein